MISLVLKTNFLFRKYSPQSYLNGKQFSTEQKTFNLHRRDILLKSFSNNFRVSVVNTTHIVKTAQKKHKLENHALGTELLGKTLTASLLFSSFLKGEERIKINFLFPSNFPSVESPINQIVAEAIHLGETRGFVSFGSNSNNESYSKGLVQVSKVLYNMAKPVISTVELQKGDINSDLIHYINLAEQIPSALSLQTQVTPDGEVVFSGGVFLESLPNTLPNLITQIQQRLDISDLNHILGELKSKTFNEICRSFLAPSELNSLEPATKTLVDFYCRHSSESFVQALKTLSKDELKEMDLTSKTLFHCSFCNGPIILTAQQIEFLLKGDMK